MKNSFRHIRGFLEVAKVSSFTRAAHNLHVSQPALTVQVRQLEEDLGIRLLDRDRRQVTLTQAGHDAIKTLQRILDEFDGLVQETRGMADLQRGRLTLAVLPSIAAAWLPPLIGEFRTRYPGISIRVTDVPADRIHVLVRDLQVDLGLGSWNSRDRAIRFQPLREDDMHVFFPSGHPLERSRRPSLSKLVEYPHILTTPESSVRHAVDRALEEEGLDIEVACEVAYVSTAISMVKAGLGVAILPLSSLQAAPCEGLLHRPVGHARLKRRLGLITARRNTLSPGAEAFIAMLLASHIGNTGVQ
ncbi:LysR substrate-binding domain-containing protein [Castellaniella sp. WN]